MKHISKNSQKGIQYLHSFELAQEKNIDNLYKVYTTFSTFKERAFRECEERRRNENATSMGYIISHNSNFFTYAFKTSEGLRVETAYNSFIIPEAAE